MEKLHVQPSEIDRLPFYEYEYMISIYNDIIKERNDKESQTYEKERDKYNIGDMQKGMQKNMSQFKPPSMPSLKMPKF
jgi:hypothetical protein